MGPVFFPHRSLQPQLSFFCPAILTNDTIPVCLPGGLSRQLFSGAALTGKNIRRLPFLFRFFRSRRFLKSLPI
jgi:hypothetical protein